MPHIRIYTFDGVLASGVSGPIDVLTAANILLTDKRGKLAGTAPLFSWRVESPDGAPVRTASGQMLNVDGRLDARGGADAVIVPGPFVADIRTFLDGNAALKPIFAAVRRHHGRGALIASYCSGSFLLAEAGLLDGRIATTHWAQARTFEQRYPQVQLRAAEILTEQNRVICAGAVTTYLNLALKLIEKLAGAELAAATAKLLLIDMNRVSQASYATLADDVEHGDALVGRAQRWMERNLGQGFSLARLARHLGVSERTLNRRFKTALGQAPLRYLQSLRIEIAKRLLETRRMKVDAVCERVGYGDQSAFRQLFRRETGLSPREYRERFRRPPQAKARAQTISPMIGRRATEAISGVSVLP
jgi:transcriptional regulator GlxA family with amidase domain